MNTAEERLQMAAEKQQKEAEAAAAKEAAKLEKQKQNDEKKAKKEAEKKAKEEEKASKAAEKKKQSLVDLADDYNLKLMNGVWVPGYFHRKARYGDNAESKVDMYHAENFLFGMEIFTEQGSCSAKFTYIGPNRRYTMKNVRIAKREARPTHNNWKTFAAPVRMARGTEHLAKIKDAKIIRDVLTTQGGKANFKVRFVQDKEFSIEYVKKKVFHKDPTRLKNLNYRIKKDQAKLGIKPVLRNKDEALLLLKDIKNEVKDKKADHVIKYLQEEVSKYTAIELKQKKEAAKD